MGLVVYPGVGHGGRCLPWGRSWGLSVCSEAGRGGREL